MVRLLLWVGLWRNLKQSGIRRHSLLVDVGSNFAKQSPWLLFIVAVFLLGRLVFKVAPLLSVNIK